VLEHGATLPLIRSMSSPRQSFNTSTTKAELLGRLGCFDGLFIDPVTIHVLHWYSNGVYDRVSIRDP
jgi:hypothetical protein